MMMKDAIGFILVVAGIAELSYMSTTMGVILLALGVLLSATNEEGGRNA
jgi:hypothetical protein